MVLDDVLIWLHLQDTEKLRLRGNLGSAIITEKPNVQVSLPVPLSFFSEL
jgi:hypothetical protein